MAQEEPLYPIVLEALDECFSDPKEKEEATRLSLMVWRVTRNRPEIRVSLWAELYRRNIVQLRDWTDWALTDHSILPPQFASLKLAIQEMFSPIKEADDSTQAPIDFLFKAQRARTRTALPKPYLTYLLLVELLGYRNLGTFEKISWSVPLDVNGRAFLVEHRKFGLGIFVQDESEDFSEAEHIATKINRACRKATPFFEWYGQQQVKGSRLSVYNRSKQLFNRFRYFRSLYLKAIRANPRPFQISHSLKKPGLRSNLRRYETYLLKKNRFEWLALAAIDAFFSWTEHVFIHIAIFQGKIETGEEILKLANSDWSEKFKCAIDLNDRTSKKYFDTLVGIRRQLRNFVAHGAFGKKGEAFDFHSPMGSIPVTLSEGHPTLELAGGVDFDDRQALLTIDDFSSFLWSGDRTLLKLYIQDTDLPLRPNHAKAGAYKAAMKSRADMKTYIRDLHRAADDARNMDF